MTKSVLVPLDGSPQAWEALEYAVAMDDVSITALSVIDPIEFGYTLQASIPSFSEDWYEDAEEDVKERFEEAESLAAEHGHAIETVIEIGRPSHVIIDYTEDHDIDEIIMGSHGRSGVSRILLGSVAETIVRRSPVPVTVVR